MGLGIAYTTNQVVPDFLKGARITDPLISAAVGSGLNSAISSAVYGGNVGKAILRGMVTGLVTFGVGAVADMTGVSKLVKESFAYEFLAGSDLSKAQSAQTTVDLKEIAEFADSWLTGMGKLNLEEFYGEPVTIITESAWESYMQGIREKTRGFNLIDAPTADTYLGSNVLDNDHSLYYIEILGVAARGTEINYTGEGMLFAKMRWPLFGAKAMQFGWKVINKPFCNEWWKVPQMKDREPYKLPTKGEKFSLRYGYEHYKE